MKDTENSEGQGGAAPEGPSDGTAPEAAGQSPGPEGGTPAGEAPLPGPELKAPLRARAEGAPKAIQAGPAPPSRQGPPVAIRRPQDVKASSWPRARPGQDKPSPPASPVVVEERLGPDGEPLSLLKASPRLKVPAAPVGGPEPLDGRDAARKEPAVRKSKPSRAPGGAAEPCPAGGEAGGPRTPPAADPEGAAGPAGPSDPEGAAGPEGTSGSAGAAGPARLSLISRILKAFRDPEDGPGAPAGEPDRDAAAPGLVRVSERARGVTPFMVMEVLERARELEARGRSIIHMEVGEPDFPTPGFVVEAMRRALGAGDSFGYAHSLGDPELREALARHFRRRYGIEISPERFLVCPGTSAGMSLLFGALLEPGDKVILSDPCYSCYPNFVRFHGGVPVFLRVHERDGFRLDPDELRRLLRKERGVKALVINSPANPTGAVLGPDRLKAIAEAGVFIVSDEIYHGLSYQDERDHTILEYTDRCAVVGGLSKSWAMTGWRVGHLALPQELARPLQTLAQNFVISVNSAVQKAAIAALEEGWQEVERMREIYDSRRKLLLEGLRRLGLKVMADPAGAFYILARADHVNPDSKALVFELLEEAGVGCVPGREFGAGAEGFLRFSYAVGSGGIEEALLRLEGFLDRRGKLPS